MESDNIVIGKINKKKCYLNNGKYGHYLNHGGNSAIAAQGSGALSRPCSDDRPEI